MGWFFLSPSQPLQSCNILLTSLITSDVIETLFEGPFKLYCVFERHSRYCSTLLLVFLIPSIILPRLYLLSFLKVVLWDTLSWLSTSKGALKQNYVKRKKKNGTYWDWIGGCFSLSSDFVSILAS
jgi:hypothetical protein